MSGTLLQLTISFPNNKQPLAAQESMNYVFTTRLAIWAICSLNHISSQKNYVELE